MLCRLLVIGALLCASSISSPVQQVVYHPIAETFALEPDTEHTRFPHEESCRHFYLVLSAGDGSLKACPDDKLFDFVKHRCVEKEQANCWVRHLVKDIHSEPIHLSVRDRSKCPQPFGKFPDVTDCAHYHQCLAGRATTKKCAPYEYFDKIKRKCVAEINAVCADETDVVEPDYQCPRSLGSFSFSRDCSKYYECIEKRPDLRTCQKHMLFDEKKRKCVPHKKAHCGSRHNPYDQHTTPLQSKTIGELSEATTDVPGHRKDSSPTVEDMPITSKIAESNKLEQILTVVPKKESDNINMPQSLEDDSLNDIVFDRKSENSKGSSDEPKKEKDKILKEYLMEDVLVEKTDEPISTKDTTANLETKHEKILKEDATSTEPRKEKVENLKENVIKDVLVGKNNEPISTKDATVNLETTNIKILTEEATTESSKPEILHNTDCLPGDRTCLRFEDGSAFRCPSPTGFFSHPSDENAFLQCYRKTIYIKRCPKTLIFLQSKAACTWPIDKFIKF